MLPSQSDRSDADLVVALANGDRAALGELYDRFAMLLLAVGMQCLRDRGEAEEVLHDVFVQAWRAAGDFDPARGSVRAWLVTRMRSRALDRVRSAAVSRRTPLDEARVDRIAFVSDPEWGADRSRVQAALDSLPKEQREVIELCYFEGLSSSEIAARANLPIGTVKSRTAAAMVRLRDALLRPPG